MFGGSNPCVCSCLNFYSYFFFRDQDVATLNQSLRILANLIGAGAVSSRGILDEMINGLLSFTSALTQLKLSDGNDLTAKVHHYCHLTISNRNLHKSIIHNWTHFFSNKLLLEGYSF